MGTINEKLDAILRTYNDSATTDHEKDNAFSMFQKLCKKHNLNSSSYMQQFTDRSTKSYHRNIRTPNGWSDGSGDFNDFFSSIFRNGGFGSGFGQNSNSTYNWNANRQAEYDAARRRQDENIKKQQEAKNERKRQENINKMKNNSKIVATNHTRWTVKEVIAEVKIVNGSQVIIISALASSTLTNNRFAIQNFCLYTESEYFRFTYQDGTPSVRQQAIHKEFFRDKEFVLHTNDMKYFRDHYQVVKLWECARGTEVKLEF